ncbi:hypothetical protein KUCAC02_023536 [Chaenocephalus aceratus]|uniref:Uncharacterized protein n=1 Tax=Chaenocephalus aceratus TaxID=36190 RepID=A0ACB9XRM8_CHAAC|nr:hypothetical protein KUCAC02_023536 [Chaenocephalus aceratus]
MGAEHEHLLFHCEVRWLSKGKVLQRVWELREQVMAYLKNENANLVKHFEDKRWLARFAYLVDIFNKLNMLNTSLQGKENSILDLEDGIQGFEARLGLWHSQLVAGELAMFPVLTAYQVSTGLPLSDSVKQNIVEHLSQLQENFKRYFPDSQRAQNLQWVKFPFQAVPSQDLGLSQAELEALVTLQVNRGKTDLNHLELPRQKDTGVLTLSMKGPYPRCARTARQHRHGMFNYARERSISPQNPPRPLQLVIAY